ncbi:NfeD family protein [Verrucomicrobiota bacterium]
MDPSIQLFAILLISGLMLLGSEIFVPGGILGAIGGLALLGAAITGFFAFPGYGVHISIGIIFLAGVAIALWIKLFPKSSIGKSMTVSTNLATSKGTEEGLKELLGQEGEASSDLRPGGFALINGHRVDVVTQGGMISKGKKIKVIEIEGNRVVVKKV